MTAGRIIQVGRLWVGEPWAKIFTPKPLATFERQFVHKIKNLPADLVT